MMHIKYFNDQFNSDLTDNLSSFFRGSLAHCQKLVSFLPLHPPILIQSSVCVRINTDLHVRFFCVRVYTANHVHACTRSYLPQWNTSSFDDFLRDGNLGKEGGSLPKGGCHSRHHENSTRLQDRLCSYVCNHVTIVSLLCFYVCKCNRDSYLTIANYRKFAT